ncbi:MAG: DUF2771 domain-containing protein [Mycobacterium sp.]|nr:DUF2771 domain-containing protein [Mycobacterium sp.]
MTGWILAVVVVIASAAAGVGAWLATRESGPALPQISVYSGGETVRVGPFLYCNVVNLDDCAAGGEQGTLPVTAREPIQLSVPSAIGRAPWRLLTVYEDERDTTSMVFRPGSRLAVTIPTQDQRRGRVVGVVVQVMTLVRDQNDAVFDLPHGEWSVQMTWSAPEGREPG